MENVIEFKQISKRFFLTREPKTLFKLIKKTAMPDSRNNEIWALKDINFSVRRGEKIGIIGDNGSGKTTLIRIMLGIFRQTSGTAKINAEASGFLNLGLGMQPDLSALENIYIYGAIMGLYKSEIDARLDDIIDFSGIRNFIDCPLREFSSGMCARLAFSIAKEVDSEIIVLDEVLATGDVGFKEKCYNVFKSYKNSDKTLVVASHDMDSIKHFCTKTMLLDNGRQIAFGPTDQIIDKYIKRQF